MGHVLAEGVQPSSGRMVTTFNSVARGQPVLQPKLELFNPGWSKSPVTGRRAVHLREDVLGLEKVGLSDEQSQRR